MSNLAINYTSPRPNGFASGRAVELTAYHEAGHAVLACRLGARVLRVTVEPENDDGPARFGDTQVEWPTPRWTARDLAIREIKVALAGPVCEMLYSGERIHPAMIQEWHLDWQMATHKARTFLPDDEELTLVYLETMCQRIIDFFDQAGHWAAVAALADELLARETLYEHEIREVVGFWLNRA